MGNIGNALVVEDSKFFSELVSKSIAERTGLDVTRALTFAEARVAVEQGDKKFDIALCDLILPDCEEGENVAYLRAENIPCVVFSGAFSDDLRERMFALDVVDYVIKDTPASLDYLLNLVERLQQNKTTKVIVVDDSTVARHYVRGLLELYQFQVLEASSGSDALAATQNEEGIKLVVTDFHMPDMNGVELTKAIRKHQPQDKLAIIGFSAGGGGALSAEFLKSGANDYINKPFLREEFFSRINQNMHLLDMMQSLKNMATTDQLTKIHNRRFFFEAGEALFSSAKLGQIDLTLTMIDIDFFKRVNDTYGHDAGDEVLKTIAMTLRNECRQSDIVARLGGEEFVVLAVNLGERAPSYIKKLRKAIETLNVPYAGQNILVTASFSVSRTADESLDMMLKAADEMLYEAKQNGRNQAVFAEAA